MITINVETLNNKLTDNPDNIIIILKKLGFEENKIKYNPHKKLISCPRREGDNPMGTLIYTSSLNVMETTRSFNGSVYSLIMKERKCSFPQALDFAARCLGLKSTTDIKIKYPFGRFYHNLLHDDDHPEDTMPTFEDTILPPANNFSYKFVRDGISVDTQREFGIRYSHADDSILIPVQGITGQLVGVKARNNNPNCDWDSRWYAWQPYSKTYVLYGLNQNYFNVMNKKSLFVFESEKSVLQAHDMGFYPTVALGGHSISEVQARQIRSLNVERIVFCMDSDISEDEVRYNLEKCKVENQFFKNKLGYVYGGFGPELKASPTDFGKKAFKGVLKNNIKWM